MGHAREAVQRFYDLFGAGDLAGAMEVFDPACTTYTHTGDLVSADGTIPASGKPLDLGFMDYFRVADGRIVEHRTVFDQMEMLTQLNAIPTQ